MGRERRRHVQEESQLDDMRTAIRGDFARLAERLGEQELLTTTVDKPEPAPSEEQSLTRRDMRAEPESRPHRSWLARLLSP